MKSTTAPSHTAITQDSPSLLSLYCELTKIRLSMMVVITTAVGFIMASTLGVDWMRMLWTVLGTTCCACAAAALNQLAEHSKDAAMNRTKYRPIPAGHISPLHAFIVGVLLSYVGVAIISFGASVGAAGLALLTILIYVLIYTPLKTRTSFNTIVGAVVGAIPPLIGWVAAAGSIGRGGIILGGILFIWQLPHFLALAWMYKDDYQTGGFKMLPLLDESGELTARASVMTSMCLVPLALFMSISGSTHILFAIVGSILGLWVTSRSIAFWRKRDYASARRLFFATIIYLPILLAFMLIDRQTVQWIEMGT
jgi:protoheme IX farnesyltransferase